MLLSKADLARELCCSTKTIERLDAAGRLPHPVLVGGKKWVRDVVVAWTAAGCPRRAEWERLCAANNGARRA
jgi:hypothetical protein